MCSFTSLIVADTGSEDAMTEKQGDPQLQRRQALRRFPRAGRHDRTGSDRHPHAVRQDRQVHLRPGLHVDGSCSSAITYIDGDKGELLYRGYPIEQLAEHCDFLETCYLLLYGELPNSEQKDDFVDIVTHHTMVHEQMQFFMQRLPPRCAPDGGADAAWSARCPRSITTRSTSTTRISRDISAIRLIAKMPTLVAMAYKYSVGPAVHVSAERRCRTPRTSCA